MSILTAIAYATGWLIGQGIRVADWLLQDIGTGRGEVAEAPDPVDEHAATYDPLWRPRCTGVFAGSDLIDSTVPADAGDLIAREIEDYLRSIR